MRMKGSLAIYAALALSMIAPALASAASNPIVIQQCFVTVPKPMSKLASGTLVVYVNRGKKTASQVTFTVAYRNSASQATASPLSPLCVRR